MTDAEDSNDRDRVSRTSSRVGISSRQSKPIVCEDVLTAEQVAIYRAAVADFRPTPGETPQLANITVLLRRQRTAFEKCVAGIREPLEHDRTCPYTD